MLKIDLFGLKEGINPLKLPFSGDIPLFRQLDIELAGQVTLVGTVDKRDSDLYLLSLSMSVPVSFHCRRCLDVFMEEIKVDLMLVAMMKNKPGIENFDEEDVLYIEPNQKEIDLEDILREHFLLNLPAHPLCSENCRGICPGCGADLNHENCSCVE